MAGGKTTKIEWQGESDDQTRVLAAVWSVPEHEHLIALEPEFISPQDGQDQQDGE